MNIIDFEKNPIRIPQDEVIDQKCALQLLLNKFFDCDIVCEKTFPWMRTPSEFDATYNRIFKALCQSRNSDPKFARKNYELRCDFVSESKKTIIEYDERQHFSAARAIALNAYKDIKLNYNRDLWIRACNEVNAHDNAPAYRDEGRAFFDSTRDIQAYRNGYKLVRIRHGQIDFTRQNAYDELVKLFGNNIL